MEANNFQSHYTATCNISITQYLNNITLKNIN